MAAGITVLAPLGAAGGDPFECFAGALGAAARALDLDCQNGDATAKHAETLATLVRRPPPPLPLPPLRPRNCTASPCSSGPRSLR
eukprot:142852-Prorocentrum_minimum.AAC.1